jgi:SAM-dependent methyltransferase
MQYRDTDRDWELMAKDQPYFAVITNPKYAGPTLSDEAQKEFFQSGVLHVEGVLAIIRSHFDSTFKPHVAVDFGCGVGRVLLPLASESEKAVGVDVSEAMLDLARKHASEKGLSNILFMRSDENLEALSSGYDFLHSVIVLQHIPPSRGYILLRNLFEKLCSGGYFYLHLTFAKDRSFLDNAVRHVQVYHSSETSISILEESPAEGSTLMSMYDYDLNKVFLTLMNARVDTLLSHFTNHGGCYGIVLCGRKA